MASTKTLCPFQHTQVVSITPDDVTLALNLKMNLAYIFAKLLILFALIDICQPK